jgi:hypothetical protein
MAGMKKNVVLYTPDGKTSNYTEVQHLQIDERGILTFTTKGDKTITTTLPFTVTDREQ